MSIIDMHADTILLLVDSDSSLKENNLQIDLKKLKKGNYMAQCFAMFVDLKRHKEPFKRCLEMIDRYHFEINNSEEISFAYNYNDIINNNKKGLISAILTIEEGEVIEGDLKKLEELFNLGVRMITLTWNYDNQIASPNIALNRLKENEIPNLLLPNTNDGLTSFGIEVVKKMNDLGIIIDVSHLSDKGFYDSVKHSKKPIVASHSNARSLCKNVRNMTDDMIISLAKNGGIMGINFCHNFLSDDSEEGRNTIKYAVKHIKYIKSLVGIDYVGLGSDFDGIDPNIELDTADKMSLLVNELKKEGFTDTEIDKLTHQNFLRVLQANLS